MECLYVYKAKYFCITKQVLYGSYLSVHEPPLYQTILVGYNPIIHYDSLYTGYHAVLHIKVRLVQVHPNNIGFLIKSWDLKESGCLSKAFEVFS